MLLVGTDPPFDTLRWYREAELQHGRVAQLAWLGFAFPSSVYHFPSKGDLDFSELNPIDAFYKVIIASPATCKPGSWDCFQGSEE